jgi:Type II CAAX prenyl endopeptidase Rce1-like
MATAIVTGLAFGAYMAVADEFVFRAVVPQWQIVMIKETTAIQRITLLAPLALLDEIAFRLLFMSALVWLLTLGTDLYDPAGAGRRARFWVAIIAVATIYVPLHPAYLTSLGPLTTMVAVREAALHTAAGVLWGYLYWRYGFLAAAAGHISAHVTLQPLLGEFFS